MTGVRNGLILYIQTYYWGLDSNQISWFVAGSMLGYVVAGVIVAPLHRRMDKRWTATVAGIFYAFAPAVPLLLGLMGILTPHTPGLLLILISFAVFMYAPYSLLTTTARSLLASASANAPIIAQLMMVFLSMWLSFSVEFTCILSTKI